MNGDEPKGIKREEILRNEMTEDNIPEEKQAELLESNAEFKTNQEKDLYVFRHWGGDTPKDGKGYHAKQLFVPNLGGLEEVKTIKDRDW